MRSQIERLAEIYLSRGWSLLPVARGSKKPLLEWKKFTTERPSFETVKEWFKKWPDCNLGIITGSISNLAVIDLDGPTGIAEAAKLGLTSPLTVLTGKGKHLYYQCPTKELKNSVRLLPGIDIRAENGFVLAPPSVHESGRRYRLLGSVPYASTLPPFPAVTFATDVGTTLQAQVGNASGWIAKALEEMKIGNIDDTLFKVCSRLRNDGYSEADVFTLLEPHARRVNAEDGHLSDKIRNVWGRYEPKGSALSGRTNGSHQLILHSPGNADSVNEYDKRQQSSLHSAEYASGYVKFDTLTKGLRRGELLTVAARTGVGKTNWVLGPIKSFCKAGKKVVLFSTEMSFDQIWSRYKATLDKSDSFSTHSFYICDEFTPHPERIEEALKEVEPDLFVFDHVSHVATEHHELSKFMMSLKELARKFNIPGIVTAQLNRAADWVEKGERVQPRLSMIKGSGSIEEISAQVLLLSEKRVHANYTEIEGIVDKNRHGDKGVVSFGLFKEPNYHMKEL